MSDFQKESGLSWPDLIGIGVLTCLLGIALARIQNRVESIERKVDLVIEHSGFTPKEPKP